MLRKKILETFDILRPQDVVVAATGENGEDIKLSKLARRILPYQFETKNREKFAQLYSFFKQGCNHGNLETILVCKMNKEAPLVVMSFDHFFELVKD